MSTNLNQWDKEGQGKLWNNDKKESDKQPDFTGSLVLDGVKYSLAGWNNVSKAGDTYIGVRIKPWEDRDDPENPTEVKTDQTTEMTKEELKEFIGDVKKGGQETDDLPF
tara:strand:+ start:231 stop:557 length:327 start_codon:yes stop_codon:yes gene_type:complete